MKNKQLEYAFDLLRENRTPEVFKILSQFDPKTTVEHRIYGHIKGKLLLCEQNYDLALVQFMDTLIKYGPHSGLRCDILLCYFHLGDFSKLKEEINRLVADFPHFKICLGNESQFRTEIFIAKMFEECCSITDATAIYEKMTIRTDPRERRKALANLLRVHAFFSNSAKVKSTYFSLYKSISSNYEIEIEVEHALILAELSLFQDSSAESRLEKVLSRASLREEDRNILLYDYTELCLLLGRKPSRRLPEAQNDFEKILKYLATQNTSDFFTTNTIAFEKISLYPFLRLLLIMFKNVPKIAIEAHEKILSILETLEPQDRILLQDRMSEDLSKCEWFIEYSVSQSTLKMNNRSLKLKPNLANLLIIEALETESSMGLETFFRKMWRGPYDDSHHDRLRMIVARLNRIFIDLCGTKAFKVSQDKITKLKHIKLRRIA